MKIWLRHFNSPPPLFFIVCLLFLQFSLKISAQNAGDLAANNFPKIQQAIFEGNFWALRDMATLLEHPILAPAARRTLELATFFEKKDFDWGRQPNQETILQFLYQNRKKLFFDPILHVWLLHPIENGTESDFLARYLPPTMPPRVQFKLLSSQLNNALATGDTAQFSLAVRGLAALRLPNAWKFLLEIAEDERKLTTAPFPDKFNVWQILLENIKFCPLPEALPLALKWLSTDRVTASVAEIPLSSLCNHYLNVVEKKAMLLQIQAWLDSLGTPEGVQRHGFELLSGIQPTFFDEQVDYFALLESIAFAQPWAKQNATEQLIVSHHPRSLYYLAARAFRSRFRADEFTPVERIVQPFLSTIEQLTRLKIAVPDASGATTFDGKDEIWLWNYTKYWAKHWQEYEWDAEQGFFINRLKAETVHENYERLFRRLTAPNDTAALQAFRSIVEGNPREIEQIASEFRQTIRQFNPRLPSFKYRYLEQLAWLTDACRTFDEDWKPTQNLAAFIEKLDKITDPKTRYLIENQMIESLQWSDLTALEFETIIRENDLSFAFSSARVLAHCYHAEFSNSTPNNEHLRFFLKKSAIFQAMKSNGLLNHYLDFIIQTPDFQQLIIKLSTSDIDFDIQKQAQLFLEKNLKVEKVTPSSISVEQDLNNQADFQKKIDQFLASDAVSSDMVNAILGDKLYQTHRHKLLILNNLQKVYPLRELARLQPSPKFSGKSDFQFFAKLHLPHKIWVDLLRLFDGEAAPEILLVLTQKLSDAPDELQGSLLNEAMRHGWVRHYFSQLTNTNELCEIFIEKIEKWREEMPQLSDFEDETSQLHLLLLRHPGKTCAEKLKSAITLDLEKNVAFRVQREIVAAARWSDLAEIAPLFRRLQPSPNGLPGFAFLNQDFGFPPFDFLETAENELLTKNLSQFSEAEVYKFYLRKFGVEIVNPTEHGNLDFKKIKQILMFDLLQPFVGASGERRDWYVFAVIKCLEHHFNDRLGFHEKLNENQTFYTFNAGKRAATWLQFLKNQRLID